MLRSPTVLRRPVPLRNERALPGRAPLRSADEAAAEAMRRPTLRNRVSIPSRGA